MIKIIAVGLGAVFSCSVAAGATYSGNKDKSDFGVVGLGSLDLSDSSGTISMTFHSGINVDPGLRFNEVLVFYIDSIPNAGLNSTATLAAGSGLAAAVAGCSTGARATAQFVSGFKADYAIAFSSGEGAFIYQLGEDGSVTYRRQLHPAWDNNAASSYSLSFDWNDIGLGSASSKTFSFESSYSLSSGYRYLESFEQTSGAAGFSTITFTSVDTYPLAPVPEPANAALAIFGGVAFCVWLVPRVRRALAPVARIPARGL